MSRQPLADQLRPDDDNPATRSFLTLKEVAELLGLHERTIRRRIKDGSIRKAPLAGSAVRISMEELARLRGGAMQAQAISGDVISSNYEGFW